VTYLHSGIETFAHFGKACCGAAAGNFLGDYGRSLGTG